MSIERLNRAAMAAGFAMAAPDDEPGMDREPMTRRVDVPTSANLPAVYQHQRPDFLSAEFVAQVLALGSRLRERLPHLNGRATA